MSNDRSTDTKKSLEQLKEKFAAVFKHTYTSLFCENSLKKSKEKFAAVFEHANDAILIVDMENDSIVDCNPAAEKLVGFSKEELLSMPASDLHPHNLEEFMDFAGTVMEEGEGWTDDISCYSKNGDILPAEMSASVVELDGRPHIINHIRETTDRQERDWFEALIEHSTDLITVIKPDGSIRYQSSSIERVLGYEPSEIRDENLFEFVHPDDKTKVQESLNAMADSESDVLKKFEYRFRDADGSWAWLDTVISYRPDTTITGYVLNSRDITSRKESRQQAAVLNRMLRHNLRNGLTVILGHAEGIAESDSSDLADSGNAILKRGRKLYEQSEYAKDLADILETSSISRESFDVTELVGSEVDRLDEDYPDATFEVNIPSDQQVMGAPKLDIAFRHVLKNAVEHNDSNQPHITVTTTTQTQIPTSSEMEYISITVADNGPGIPKQEREVLTEGKETDLRHGSGLGFWIVNWIITRSGGNLDFEKNEPRGSQVILSLPEAE